MFVRPQKMIRLDESDVTGGEDHRSERVMIMGKFGEILVGDERFSGFVLRDVRELRSGFRAKFSSVQILGA